MAIDGGLVVALAQQMTSSQFSIAELFVTVDGVNWSRYEAPVSGFLAVIAPSTVVIAGGVETKRAVAQRDARSGLAVRVSRRPGGRVDHARALWMFSQTDGVLPVTLDTEPRPPVAFLVTTDKGRAGARPAG